MQQVRFPYPLSPEATNFARGCQMEYALWNSELCGSLHHPLLTLQVMQGHAAGPKGGTVIDPGVCACMVPGHRKQADIPLLCGQELPGGTGLLQGSGSGC